MTAGAWTVLTIRTCRDCGIRVTERLTVDVDGITREAHACQPLVTSEGWPCDE